MELGGRSCERSTFGGERRRSTDSRGVHDKGWDWQILNICQLVSMKPPLLLRYRSAQEDPPLECARACVRMRSRGFN